MYHLSPYSYLIEGLLGSSKSLNFMSMVPFLILPKPSATVKSTVLKSSLCG